MAEEIKKDEPVQEEIQHLLILHYRGRLIMFTNKKGCTVYEKALKNRENTYIRNGTGAVYWENSFGEKSGKDRTPENFALVIIPEKSADYLPKADDRIVPEIIADERPPATAMTIVKVRDFRCVSANLSHIEVTAE